MKHKEITVGLSETHSLPEYSNIRTSISYTTVLEEGDDPTVILGDLRAACLSYIQSEIDAARERRGLPALYSTEKRVSLRRCSSLNLVFLTPLNAELRDCPGNPTSLYIPLDTVEDYRMDPNNQRYTHALKCAQEYALAHGLEFIDWSDMAPDAIVAAMWETLQT